VHIVNIGIVAVSGVGSGLTIEARQKRLGGAKHRNLLGRNLNRFPSFWISPYTPATLLRREDTKASELDPMTTRQGISDFIKDRIYNCRNLPVREVRIVRRELRNQF